MALIAGHVSTRAELNEWEAANILDAEEWVFARRREKVLTIDFAKRLHERMFDRTWEWAGRFRHSEKNIGISWEHVPEALQNLFDDVRYWLEHGTFAVEEVAARLHHRLTQIHPFPNGNGRFARLFTDVFLTAQGLGKFVWGREDIARMGDVRERYIDVLRAADGGDFGPLLEFLGVEPA